MKLTVFISAWHQQVDLPGPLDALAPGFGRDPPRLVVCDIQNLHSRVGQQVSR